VHPKITALFGIKLPQAKLAQYPVQENTAGKNNKVT